MGIIHSIKFWLVKRKKKKKTKSEQAKEALIVLVFLAPLMTFVMSFTTYGADASQYFINNNPDASWAPWLQWRTAKIYQLWTSYKAATEAYHKYYTNYSKQLTSEQIIEAEYWELSCFQDGEQYETAFTKVEEFLERWAGYEGNPYHKKAEGMFQNLRAMESSKRIDNPLGWY